MIVPARNAIQRYSPGEYVAAVARAGARTLFRRVRAFIIGRKPSKRSSTIWFFASSIIWVFRISQVNAMARLTGPTRRTRRAREKTRSRHASPLHNVRTTLEMIKIEHTLFALPFAFLARYSQRSGLPSGRQLALDHRGHGRRAFDGNGFQSNCGSENTMLRNPRTSNRALPAGLLSVGFVWAFTRRLGLSFFAAAMLNRLTLGAGAGRAAPAYCSIRFPNAGRCLSHLLLGWCLSIAPTGAWIAVRGALDSPVPLLLSLVVMLVDCRL